MNTLVDLSLFSEKEVSSSRLDGVVLEGPIEGCEINAFNDREAVLRWLEHCQQKNMSRHTLTNYLKEARRFIRWLESNQLTLRDMLIADANKYVEHMRNPTPQREWVGKRRPFGSEDWKPFVSGLNGTALSQAITILGSMCKYLLNVGYLAKNPFRTTGATRRNKANAAGRALSTEMLIAMLETAKARNAGIETKRDGNKNVEYLVKECARVRWIIALLFYTGARIQEIADGTMSDFKFQSGVWMLELLGKGAKVRLASAPDELMAELKEYRSRMGLSSLPLPTDETPLVSSIKRGISHGICTKQIYNIVKDVCLETSERISDQNPHLSVQMKKISPHWFRHGNAYERVKQGQSIRDIAEELGHADLSTTKIYIDDRPEERAKRHRGFKMPEG